MRKTISFNLILIFVLFFVLAYPTLAISSFNLGTGEIKVSKELKEAEVMTYTISLLNDIEGISYYIRSQDPSMCWLRLYDSNGKNVYSKDFGDIFGRFLGRSESQIIENLTSTTYTLDVMAPSYGTCIYELNLKGLTKQKLATTPDTEIYKTNQELIRKTNEINSLKITINNLKEEVENKDKDITRLEGEKEEISNILDFKENTIQTLIKEKEDMQKRLNLLTNVGYALIIIILSIAYYFFYKYVLKPKRKRVKKKK